MREALRNVPIAACGVMLALASLGTLLQSLGEVFYVCFGFAAACVLFVMLAKFILFPETLLADLKHPIFSGIAGTFPMALMSFSMYLLPVSKMVACVVWVAAICIHMALIVNYVVRVLIPGGLKQITPATYIVLGGFVLANLTGTVYLDTFPLREIFLNVGVVVTVVLFVAVTARLVIYPLKEKTLKPLLCIYTAIFSMYLAACLVTVHPSSQITGVWYAICCCAYLFSFVNMLKCLRLPFAPTYAALTFPFVISATASIKVVQYFGPLSSMYVALNGIALFETLVAVLLTVYVAIRFVGKYWPRKD